VKPVVLGGRALCRHPAISGGGQTILLSLYRDVSEEKLDLFQLPFSRMALPRAHPAKIVRGLFVDAGLAGMFFGTSARPPFPLTARPMPSRSCPLYGTTCRRSGLAAWNRSSGRVLTHRNRSRVEGLATQVDDSLMPSNCACEKDCQEGAIPSRSSLDRQANTVLAQESRHSCTVFASANGY